MSYIVDGIKVSSTLQQKLQCLNLAGKELKVTFSITTCSSLISFPHFWFSFSHPTSSLSWHFFLPIVCCVMSSSISVIVLHLNKASPNITIDQPPSGFYHASGCSEIGCLYKSVLPLPLYKSYYIHVTYICSCVYACLHNIMCSHVAKCSGVAPSGEVSNMAELLSCDTMYCRKNSIPTPMQYPLQ